MSIKLKLNPAQAAVLWKILTNIKLGDENVYENAISALVRDMEHDGIEEYINEFHCATEFAEPVVSVQFNEEDGLILSITESTIDSWC